MRLQTTCYRGIDPKWAHLPLSGEGAAIHGARLAPRGKAALHFSLDANTAIKEAQATTRGQGVDGANSSVISIEGAPFVRERRAISDRYVTPWSLQFQRLSLYSPLMCH